MQPSAPAVSLKKESKDDETKPDIFISDSKLHFKMCQLACYLGCLVSASCRFCQMVMVSDKP